MLARPAWTLIILASRVTMESTPQGPVVGTGIQLECAGLAGGINGIGTRKPLCRLVMLVIIPSSRGPQVLIRDTPGARPGNPGWASKPMSRAAATASPTGPR